MRGLLFNAFSTVSACIAVLDLLHADTGTSRTPLGMDESYGYTSFNYPASGEMSSFDAAEYLYTSMNDAATQQATLECIKVACKLQYSCQIWPCCKYLFLLSFSLNRVPFCLLFYFSGRFNVLPHEIGVWTLFPIELGSIVE